MRIVAFDFESHLLKPGLVAPRPVCLSWASGAAFGLLARSDVHAWLRTQLADPSVLLVGQNVSYDVGVAVAEWPALWPAFRDAYDADRIHDTMIGRRYSTSVMAR